MLRARRWGLRGKAENVRDPALGGNTCIALGSNQVEKMETGKEESKNSVVQSLDAKESHVCNSNDSWGWQGICFGLERVCT